MYWCISDKVVGDWLKVIIRIRPTPKKSEKLVNEKKLQKVKLTCFLNFTILILIFYMVSEFHTLTLYLEQISE